MASYVLATRIHAAVLAKLKTIMFVLKTLTIQTNENRLFYEVTMYVIDGDTLTTSNNEN